MKLGIVPENLVERLALLSGMLPPGIFECWFGIMLSRTVMAATRLDVFESLAAGPLTVAEVADRCVPAPLAECGTRSTLDVSAGHLERSFGSQCRSQAAQPI